MRLLITVDPEIPVPPKLYGGIERIINGLIEELRRRGHIVGLVANRASSCAADQLYPWPAGYSGGALNLVRNTVALTRAVRTFQPEVVHSFSRLAYLVPIMRKTLPKIMSYQRATGGKQLRLAAALAGKSLTFTACSKFIAGMGAKFGGLWEVIPNFVDTTFYQFSPAVLPNAPLLFLSRIEEIKGAHVAIDIARRTNRRLIIAGNRIEAGAGALYWRERVAPQIDGELISYVGPVDDKQKRTLLMQAAALVVPIQWDEPFGIVFAEALACGTPVISCPRGALPEIVIHREHGVLVRSVEEGVTAVEDVATLSRASCRARAEDLFSANVVTSIYEDLYRRVATGRG